MTPPPPTTPELPTVAMPFVDLQAQRLRIEADVRRRIDAVLEHGQFILGPEVADLEEALSEFAGVPHTLGCANGTDALVLAFRALGVEAGDRIVVPAFTFCATAEAVALCGAVPVFADVDARTFNVTPATVETALDACDADGNPAVGVVAVDLFGQPADYPGLHRSLVSREAWLLADAAQSFGGSYGDQRVGNLAEITTLSFFPAKPFGCYGDGGAVMTRSDVLAERLRSLHFHGKGEHQYDNVRVGYNSRLDSIQAAVLLAKLEIFADELKKRRQVAVRYDEGLSDVVTTPYVAPTSTTVWAQYTILLDGVDRDVVAAGLREQGIPTGVYYAKPLHRQEAYSGYHDARIDLSVSEDLADRVLSLPIHAYLDEADQDRIVAALRQLL